MARKTADAPKFKRKQKVVAIKALPGVPVGTTGVVYYEAGITWFRYHVAFENGIELGNVDGNSLTSLDDWRQKLEDDRRAELLAAREARTAEQRQLTVTRGPSH